MVDNYSLIVDGGGVARGSWSVDHGAWFVEKIFLLIGSFIVLG